jgi:hypothetical protein
VRLQVSGIDHQLGGLATPKFDSKSGNFAIFNFLMPYFSMSYCPRASCFGETLL